MPRYRDDQDELDDVRDWEDPDESDMDDDDDPEVVECPYCRKMISEEAGHCHHCGNYISKETAPRRLRVWIIIGMVFLVFMVLVFIVRH
jgi:hypothetical protein